MTIFASLSSMNPKPMNGVSKSAISSSSSLIGGQGANGVACGGCGGLPVIGVVNGVVGTATGLVGGLLGTTLGVAGGLLGGVLGGGCHTCP